MSINIKTIAVNHMAHQISTVNTKIDKEFSTLESVIKNLDAKWDGSAAYIAMQDFKSLKNTYCDNRYNVINDLVNFMCIQVKEGYEDTETANVSNAAAFK